ncbi:MAG: PEP-CTERM sorting domain-containing protein [Aquabacterium sp.]|jgi:hypothetical protein|uniref:PEP-CTERM sorting domain-containing protein n=1 Tax=Aquabacterium sp. TaxID=1872578 RepID=UPI002A36B51F|nr:PEP-CTERM sorting domain-containing protein [Aquabacterium sp.]MDX9844276.1 PEP-CTERM sorting domain-containing protein [Aquabacterium sp.]
MSSSHHPWTSLVALVRRTVSALALAAMASSASAAMFTFDGQVDDMAPLGGSRITGSFAYNEPAESGLVEVPLSAFTLTFLGQTYTLASPNVLAAAWVNNGLFDGFDFLYQDDWASPSVSLHLFSGGFFSDPFAGLFGFTANPLDAMQAETSWGGFTVTPSAVPEPSMLGLLLAGAVAACVARRCRPS